MAERTLLDFWGLPGTGSYRLWDDLTAGNSFTTQAGGVPFSSTSQYYGQFTTHKTAAYAQGSTHAFSNAVFAGGYFYFTGTWPPRATAPNIYFLNITDAVPDRHVQLALRRKDAANTELVVFDETGTDVATSDANVIINNTWRYVVMGVELDDPGRVVVWVGTADTVNNNLINFAKEIDSDGHDFTTGNAVAGLRLQGQLYLPDVPPDETTVRFYAPFLMGGCNLDDHVPGARVVEYWRPDLNSATPDYDISGVAAAGDDLDSGQWDDAGDEGAMTFAGYDDVNDEGAIDLDGPLGQDTRQVLAANWYWAGRGELAANKFRVAWGYRNPESSAAIMSDETSDIQGIGVKRYRKFQSNYDVAANRVPNADHSAVIGFKSLSATTHMDLYEAVCAVLCEWDTASEVAGGVISKDGRIVV